MIAVLDSGGSNIASILYALKRLGYEGQLTSDAAQLELATHWILPGVGTAKRAMRKLSENGLASKIQSTKKPVLGICLGMQILFESSEEGGNVSTLGVIQGKVATLPNLPHLRVPHLGWNNVKYTPGNPLFEEIPQESDFYFVHSFAAPTGSSTQGITHYGLDFSSSVQLNNFYGVQFHPERSGQYGQLLLRNFVEKVIS